MPASQHLEELSERNSCGGVNDDLAKWRVTQEMLEREIRKLIKAKAEHSGG